MDRKKREELHLKWITDSLLPELAAAGCFSDNRPCTIINKQFDDSTVKGVDFFSSNNFFVTLTLQEQNGGQITQDIVIKSASPDETFRYEMRSNELFFNESLLYKILPVFKESLQSFGIVKTLLPQLIPKHFHASFNIQSPEKSIVILENLKKTGFRPPVSKVELDYEHCKIAMEKLGQFHALSYALKLTSPETLMGLVKDFKEAYFADYKREGSKIFYTVMLQHVFKLVYERNGTNNIPETYLRKLQDMVKDPMERFDELLIHKEPLAVMCHGDYNRNNILFKYDSNGSPIDMKMIDFQTSRYASPAIDLTFFFFQNTTPELRHEKFSELLNIYCDMIRRTVSQLVGDRSQFSEIYSREALVKEVGEYALYGMMLASFFVPMMMNPSGKDFEESMTTQTDEEAAIDIIEHMDQAADKRVVGMIVDFYKFGFYQDPKELRL